jgi:hypothetical protein
MTKRSKKAWTKWRKLVREQARSGQTVIAFCRELLTFQGAFGNRYFALTPRGKKNSDPQAWKSRVS